jgi:hypothetical protein
MYTGTLIEELISVVERAEEHVRELDPETELERWYTTAHSNNPRVQPNLAGVA